MAEEPETLEDNVPPEASRREALERRVAALRARQAELANKRQEFEDLKAREEAEEEEARNVVVDTVLVAPTKGIENAFEGAVRTIGDLGDAFDEKTAELLGLPSLGSITFGSQAKNGIIGFLGPQEFADLKASGKRVGFKDFDIDILPTPETTPGRLVEGVSRFIAGFAFFSKQMKAAGFLTKLNRGGQLARAAGIGAAVDFTVFDPQEGRLSDLLVSLEVEEDDNDLTKALKSAVKNDITEFLASKEDDSRLEARLKNSLEGLILGGAVDTIIQGLRFIKLKRVAQAEQVEALRIEQADKEGVKFLEPEPPAPKAVAKEAAEPPKKATEEPQASTKDVDEPKVEGTKPQAPRIRITEEQAKELVKAVEEGDLSKAQGTLDFNEKTIDWEKLGSDPEGIRKLINTFSVVLEEVVGVAGKNVQPFAATRRIANLVGSSAETVHKLHADVVGGGGLAARVLASERIMLASAQRLQRLAKELKEQRAGGVVDANKMREFHRQVEIHGAIQAEIRGAKSEVGRALRAMAIMKSASEESFSEFDKFVVGQKGFSEVKYDDLLDRVLRAKNPASLNAQVRTTFGRKVRDVLIEIFINGLLSGIKTQVINLSSNMGQVFLGIADRFIAAGIGSVRKKVFGLSAEEVVTFREAFAFFEGTFRSMSESLVLAGRAFKEGSPISDPVQKIEFQNRRAIHIDKRQIADWQASGNYGRVMMSHGWNFVGELFRIPGRLLITGDEFFKGVGRGAELHALAARNANLSADIRIADGSLKESQRKAFVKKAKDKILKDPSPEIQAEAIRFSRKQTFQEESGVLGKGISRVLNHSTVLKLMIAPFLRTPMNIIRQAAFERGPLGLLSAGTKAPGEIIKIAKGMDNAFLKGGREADLAIAKMTVGMSAMTIAASWALDGKIVGSRGGYTNTAQFDGVEPYSIWLFGRWIPYNRFDPIGTLMGFTADMIEIMAAADDPNDPEFEADGSAMLGAGLAALSGNVLEKTWLVGLSDLVEVFARSDRSASSGADAAEKFIGDFMTNFTPFSSFQRSVNNSTNPIANEAFTLTERWRRKVIGAADSLPIKRDLLGRPVERRASVASFWNPFAGSEKKTDVLNKELSRLAFEFSPQPKKFNGIQLTAQQYSRALEIGGQLLKDPSTGFNLEQSLRALVKSREYKDLPFEDAKIAVVKGMISRFMSGGRISMTDNLSEFFDPDLAKDVLSARITNRGRRKGATQSQIEEELRKIDQ